MSRASPSKNLPIPPINNVLYVLLVNQNSPHGYVNFVQLTLQKIQLFHLCLDLQHNNIHVPLYDMVYEAV